MLLLLLLLLRCCCWPCCSCCCVASAVAEAGLGGERDDAAFSATRTKKRRPPSASTCHRLASTDPAAACHRRPLPPRARLRCAPGRQPPRCRCSARRCRPAARHPVGGHVFEYFTTRKHALSRRTVSRVSPLSRACWVALTSGVWRPLSRRTVRLPHTRHGSRSPVITVAAAQRARGARDGGAEQRPLARCRCSVCQPETRALPLHARLLPCPVTRRALARPPHRARSARLLAAAAARPAPPRLPPPCLTREER